MVEITVGSVKTTFSLSFFCGIIILYYNVLYNKLLVLLYQDGLANLIRKKTLQTRYLLYHHRSSLKTQLQVRSTKNKKTFKTLKK